MAAQPPLARYPGHHQFATTDPERAHDRLREIYSDHRVRLSGDRERFMFRHVFTECDRFSLAYLQHSMGMRADIEPLDRVTVCQLRSGRFRMAAGRDEIEPFPGEVFMCPPSLVLHSTWDEIRVGFMCLELTELQRVAAETTGIEPAALHFARYRPISAGRARHWGAVVRHVSHSLLPNVAAMASPLIRTATFRLLAVTLLEVFPNTALGTEHFAYGVTAPAAVRRAVEFIDAHAGTDISVTEIAAAARISPRGLQQAFRRHLGTTPTAYLRRVRLEGAHRDLQAADPTRGATVAEIAFRWGFAHHGRFASLYRRHYGRPPSHTLHS